MYPIITTTLELRQGIRTPYAWPGGYPMYAITSDGDALCISCCRREYRQISNAVRHKLNDGWRVEIFDINWEDAELYCAHCGEQIESAYA